MVEEHDIICSHITFIPDGKYSKCMLDGFTFKHVHTSAEFWEYQLLEANK